MLDHRFKVGDQVLSTNNLHHCVVKELLPPIEPHQFLSRALFERDDGVTFWEFEHYFVLER